MWDAVHDETTESLSDGTCSVAFECQPVRVEKSGNGKWKTENGRRKSWTVHPHTISSAESSREQLRREYDSEVKMQ